MALIASSRTCGQPLLQESKHLLCQGPTSNSSRGQQGSVVGPARQGFYLDVPSSPRAPTLPPRRRPPWPLAAAPAVSPAAGGPCRAPLPGKQRTTQLLLPLTRAPPTAENIAGPPAENIARSSGLLKPVGAELKPSA